MSVWSDAKALAMIRTGTIPDPDFSQATSRVAADALAPPGGLGQEKARIRPVLRASLGMKP